ncbi:TolC family protein [Cyclobacterium amurskyense]|uniref:Heavy metal RND efflux outer membrane protein, CzcC family n=1 Tax=Cyclobacterium amurskyense TaxID=320787 RepID=A0A0H4PCE6_9BACT|nr:TolC family protein [Cyclobacterium amurskyense]AKP52116.1 Heavy metal RND efflux outer membrane protein, CzcC family [Cyclobacterium amurskyense]
MKFTVLSITLILILSFSGQGQTLEDYFVMAAENNPGLKGKYKAFEAALQKIPQAKSLADPNLSFGYFISPVQTKLGPQRMRFSLTQMFPWFGTLRIQGDVATILAEVKYKEFLDARNSLYNQVSAVYYPLLETNELIEIENENLQILKTYKSIATSTFENGKGSLTDALRVDIMNTSAETNLEVLNQKIKSANARLNSLLGRDYDSPIEITERLTVPDSPYQASIDSIQHNPLLESLDLKIQAGELKHKLAIKQGLPNLGAGVDYVMVDKLNDMALVDNGKNVLMPTVTMSIPIFRKKYDAAKKEALLLTEAYQAKKQDVSNNLYGSFYRFKVEMDIQLDLISSFDKQIQTSKQTLELLYSSYANSGEDFEEVLRLQQQLLEYRKMKIKASVAYYAADAQLNYLTAKSY